MQGKSPATICPHCGSREFWPSRKRLPESLFGPLLPYRPFRCRACLKRYIVAKPWAWTAIVGVVAFAVGIGLLAHFGKLTLPDSLSVTAAPAPVPPPAPKVEAPPPPPPVPQTPDSLLFRLNLNVPPSGSYNFV